MPGEIFAVPVCVSEPSIQGTSCSDVGLDTGTRAEVL